MESGDEVRVEGVRVREVLFIKMFAETRLAPLRRAAAPPDWCVGLAKAMIRFE